MPRFVAYTHSLVLFEGGADGGGVQTLSLRLETHSTRRDARQVGGI